MSHLYDFLPEYPSIKDKNFNQKIYDKQEFYEERLTEYPNFPKNKGQYLNHQKIIARFLSSYTPYNGLLLFHEMGTGKTCATIAATEMIKNQGKYKGVLYLAPGRALIDNFKKELAFKCTDGSYIPENYDSITSRKKKTQMLNKKIKKFYKTNTYETFAKKSNPLLFSNYVIVMDEIHNITSENNTVYKPILKFVRACKGCKILLLSGTPMKDNGKEIFNIINLILPEKDNIGEEDIAKSIDGNTLTKTGKKLLKDIFKGRTSYLKSKSKIKKRVQGSILPGFSFIKLYSLKMHEEQSKIYLKNHDETDVQSFETSPRQIALSIYPNGSYGSTGFNKYIKKRGRKKLLSFSNEFDFPNNGTEKEKLDFVSKYSIKYAETIKLILKAKKENKIVFVYNEFVEGSGLILFSLFLKKFNFVKATNPKNQSPKDRFLLLTGTEMNKNKSVTKELLKVLNSDRNSDGNIIRVILGSQVVSEGLTFKNVQMEIVQTPHWNFSRIFQAIARGYRIGSHKALLAKGIEPVLDIYLLVATTDKMNTIDIKMYDIAEKKDILIKTIERVLMESAFDCQLNIKRNMVTNGEDGSRDCEYTDCEYICEGVNPSMRKPNLYTYNLYYSEKTIQDYIKKIKSLFSNSFTLTLSQIKQSLPKPVNDFVLLQTLSEIINKNLIIYNKYGIGSYLFENNDLYYLGNTLESTNFLDNFYNKYPYVKPDDLYKKLIKKEIGNPVIRKLCSSTSEVDIKKQFYLLKPKIANFFIEQSVLHKKGNMVLKEIMKIASPYIFENSKIKYNLYLAPNRVSYLNNDNWVELRGDAIYENTGYVEIFLNIHERFQALDWHNPYGYYFSVQELSDRKIYRYIKSYRIGDEIDFIYENEDSDDKTEVKGVITSIGKNNVTLKQSDKKYQLDLISMKKHKVNKGQNLSTLKIHTLADICMAIDFTKIKVDGYSEFLQSKEVKKAISEKPPNNKIKNYEKWLFLNSKKQFSGEKHVKKLTQKNLKQIITDFINSEPVIDDSIKLIQNYKITSLVKANI